MKRVNLNKIKNLLNKDISPRKISPRLMFLFLKQLSLLLNSGISLFDSLKVIKTQNLDKRLNTALDIVIKNLNMGKSPYESFLSAEKYFTPIVIASVKSSDKTGRLSSILDDLSEFIYEDSKNRESIKEALAYPIIVLVVTILMVGLILEYVMPTFVSVFEGAEMKLPLITRLLIGFSGFLSNNFIFIILILCLIIFIILFFRTDNNKKIKMDEFVFKYGFFSKIRRLNLEYQLTSLFYILRTGGIDPILSFEIIGDSFSNSYLKEVFYQIRSDIDKGLGQAQALMRADIFSPLLLSMFMIGEKTGKLDDILKRSKDYFASEYIFRTKRLAKLAEPVLIIIMSIVVFVVVIAVALPMFDAVNIGV